MGLESGHTMDITQELKSRIRQLNEMDSCGDDDIEDILSDMSYNQELIMQGLLSLLEEKEEE